MSIFLKILVLCHSIFALEGSFKTKGEYEVQQVRQVQVLSAKSSDHKAQMIALKKQGYNCQRISQFYRCMAFLKNKALSENIQVVPEFQRVEFGPLVGVETISEGQDVLQYKSQQQVIVDGKVYQGTSYIESPQIEKVKVGLDEVNPLYFVISPTGIGQVQEYVDRQGPFSWTRYMIIVNYPAVF